MTEAIAVVLSVALVAGAALKGLSMVLAFKSSKMVHEPLAQMQAKLNELERVILNGAMRR